MASKNKKIGKVLLFALTIGLLPFSPAKGDLEKSAHASSPITKSQYDSMYQYHALENKTSYLLVMNDLNGANKAEMGTPTEPTKNDNSNSAQISSPALNPDPTATDNTDTVAVDLENIIAKSKDSIKKIDTIINEAENRSGIHTFITGTNMGIIRFNLVQIKGEIAALTLISSRTDDTLIRLQVDNEISSLKDEKLKVENFILEQGGKFSLFGWVSTLL